MISLEHEGLDRRPPSCRDEQPRLISDSVAIDTSAAHPSPGFGADQLKGCRDGRFPNGRHPVCPPLAEPPKVSSHLAAVLEVRAPIDRAKIVGLKYTGDRTPDKAKVDSVRSLEPHRL